MAIHIQMVESGPHPDRIMILIQIDNDIANHVYGVRKTCQAGLGLDWEAIRIKWPLGSNAKSW